MRMRHLGLPGTRHSAQSRSSSLRTIIQEAGTLLATNIGSCNDDVRSQVTIISFRQRLALGLGCEGESEQAQEKHRAHGDPG